MEVVVVFDDVGNCVQTTQEEIQRISKSLHQLSAAILTYTMKLRDMIDLIPTFRGAEFVIVPSAGDTTRLFRQTGLMLGFSLRVKN